MLPSVLVDYVLLSSFLQKPCANPSMNYQDQATLCKLFQPIWQATHAQLHLVLAPGASGAFSNQLDAELA